MINMKKVRKMIQKHLFKYFYRMQLANRQFTIISNNCWGGFVYKKYGLPYRTPFVGLYLFSSDYIHLLKNFENVIFNKLTFIDAEKSRYKDVLVKADRLNKYPVAKLTDTIEIHFLHYSSKEEAEQKWNKRVKRMSFDNMLVKFSDIYLCTDQLIHEFDSLDFKNKLCFTSKEFKNCKSTVLLKECEEKPLINHEWKYSMKYINISKILNTLKA